MFKGQASTCDSVQQSVAAENILAESGTCNSVRQTFGDSCCQDECQLCETANGNNQLLDLKSEHLVQQGDISATCSEISEVLTKTAASDATCTTAKTQLASQCCYQQCTLCGEEGMSTEWYATVSFQGMATTCLGIDYMLRAEQIRGGSDRCNEFGEVYRERCCYPTNACQLCRADDTLYEVDEERLVTVEQVSQSTTTTCAAMNDGMAQIDKTDDACTAAKQAFFGQCCQLSDVINSGSPLVDPGEEGGGGGGGGEPAGNPSPSPGTPAGGSRPNGPPTPINGMPSSAEPAGSSPPNSEGQPSSSLTDEPSEPPPGLPGKTPGTPQVQAVELGLRGLFSG